MLLHKNKEEFKELVEITAIDIGLQPFQVEKDYYVSLVLKEISKVKDLNIVFKGGTSLSKCYDVINRFSEDIDLAVIFESERLTNTKRRQLKQEIIKIIDNLNFKLLNEGEIRSRRDFNRYKVKYENLYDSDEAMIEDLLIETIVAYNPYPIETLEVTNYITRYLTRNNYIDLITKYKLEPFKMIVQSINRTFVDKVFAICDYHMQQNYLRHSRHIYDIHKIWDSKYYNEKLVLDIIEDVIKDRQKYGTQNLSCIPNSKPNDILKEIVNNNVYKKDYNEITLSFLHDNILYEDAIKTIKKLLNSNIMPEYVKNYK